MKKFKVSLKILLLTIIFFLVADLLIGKFIYKKFIRKNFVDTYNDIHLEDDIYDHKFKSKLDVIYGTIRYRLCTDGNGFRSFCKNKSKNKKFDIAFIGDSFTEGVGLSYEDTFVGLLSEKIKNKNIVNLASTSYSPSIYYLKVKDLLSKNFKFEELIVFVDLSDLVDETLCYEMKNNKVIRRNTYNICFNGNVSYLDENVRSFFEKRLRLTLELYYVSKNILIKYKLLERKPTTFQLKNIRSSWTYKYDKKIYNDYTLEQSVKLMTEKMELLYNLLSENNIKMSLAIYPWPSTIYFNTDQNINYKTWKKFCENKCYNFYDLNKPFFELLTNMNKNEVINNYYFEADVHFNKLGNLIIAENFYKKFIRNK